MNRAALSVILLILLSFKSMAGDIEVPEDVEDFRRLEQCHNCYLPQGKMPDGKLIILGLPPLEPERRKPFKVYYWNIPRFQAGENNLFISRFIDDPLLNLVMTKAPGGTWDDVNAHVRAVAPETDPDQIKRYRESLGREPDGFFHAVQIQGRDSAVVWHPAHPRGKKWIFKFGKVVMTPEQGPHAGVRYLGRVTAERAVRMSDIVEDILRNEGAQGTVAFLPERFGAVFEEYAYVVREMRAIGFDFPAGGAFAVPLHALLSDEAKTLVFASRGWADRHGVEGDSISLWLVNVFLPRLVEFVAQLQLTHGIIPELHTQNIKVLFEIEPATEKMTGEILGFAFTDTTDVAVDVNIRAFNGLPTYLAELRAMRSPSIMNEKVMGETGFADHQTHFMSFLTQAIGSAYVISLPKDPRIFTELPASFFEDWEANLYQVFLDNYLAIVKAWMEDSKLNSSGVIEHLQSASQQRILMADPSPPTINLPGADSQRPTLQQAMANMRPTKGIATLQLTSFIYGALVRELAQMRTIDAIRNRRGGPAGSAGRLKAEFLARMKAGHISYFQTGFSENTASWLDSFDTQFLQLPEGIIAYQQLKFQGKKYPGVLALAHPEAAPSNIIECGGPIAAASRLVWNNRHNHNLLREMELLESLMGLIRRRD